jgi:signal transduction histidine kinase/CheY-like chemotaxis protein
MTSLQADTESDQRVLLYTPIGRDAELTHDVLARASVPNTTHRSMTQLCVTLEEQGGAVLLMTEEALDDPGFPRLLSVLERQPSWSDMPLLLFGGNSGADSRLRAVHSVEALRNVTLLERPLGMAALLSAVRAALRGRARQYEVRDLLIQLRKARAEAEEANRVKDDFLATLSHELRTPMNALLGWTSMLVRDQVDPSRLHRVYEAIDRSANAQAQLIADVLDVSRIVTGKLILDITTVDVGDLVVQAAEAVRPAAVSKDIDLRVLDAPNCRVRADAGRLQQVAWNLLSNAIKFTPAGGTVVATVACDAGAVTVTVADSGIGIPSDFLPHVFDRFRQANQTATRTYGGLGLGLAIVKQLTELHGGEVTVSSDGPGRGASFRLRLPITGGASDSGESGLAPRSIAEISLHGHVILLVDDDMATREVVAAALEHSGARVELASSAAEGWKGLHERVPDLLISDLAMPREDGLSFIARVRDTPAYSAARLPAIALSAYADARSEEKALTAGFSAFIGKPARSDLLLALVKQLLDRRDTRT